MRLKTEEAREGAPVVVDLKLSEISRASKMQLRGNISKEAISRYRLNYMHGVDMT